jgi:hypothetical protein
LYSESRSFAATTQARFLVLLADFSFFEGFIDDVVFFLFFLPPPSEVLIQALFQGCHQVDHIVSGSGAIVLFIGRNLLRCLALRLPGYQFQRSCRHFSPFCYVSPGLGGHRCNLRATVTGQVATEASFARFVRFSGAGRFFPPGPSCFA